MIKGAHVYGFERHMAHEFAIKPDELAVSVATPTMNKRYVNVRIVALGGKWLTTIIIFAITSAEPD